MGKAIVVGMSVIFILWTTFILCTSFRRISNNFSLYVRFWRIERGLRVKMALWLAIPLMMAGLFWTTVIALWGFVGGYEMSDFTVARSIGYLPFGLASLALGLFWRFDQSYGATRGDRMWWRLMLGSAALGTIASLLSWRL